MNDFNHCNTISLEDLVGSYIYSMTLIELIAVMAKMALMAPMAIMAVLAVMVIMAVMAIITWTCLKGLT